MATRKRSVNDKRSVIAEPPDVGMAPVGTGDFILNFATVADGLIPWGTTVAARDRQLRVFWPSEPMLASAIYSTCAKYAGIEFNLEGPPRVVGQLQRILNGVQFGQGWIAMWMRVLEDLFTQDNGAFIEIVRIHDRPDSPTVSMNHLDANRCARTGSRDEPVIYYDLRGMGHKLKWYQVMDLSEFPSANEVLRGIQYCAVTRMLRAAQIMRDIGIYKQEKVSGKFNRGMYFVGGVQQKTIRDVLAQQRAASTETGMLRYVDPVVIAALDPGAAVSVAAIEFAKLPDNFDEQETFRQYVNQLALAFGGDYQDFSPLPGGNLGTSQQSATLHMKARNKGARLFMKMIEHRFNYFGIIPNNVRFVYKDRDPSEQVVEAELQAIRAKTLSQLVLAGIITVEVARQLMADSDDLPYELMLKLNADKLSGRVDIQGGEPISSTPGAIDVEDEANYEGEPAQQEGELVIAGPGNANAPQNSNATGPGGPIVPGKPAPAGVDKKKLVPMKNGRPGTNGAAARAVNGRTARPT